MTWRSSRPSTAGPWPTAIGSATSCGRNPSFSPAASDGRLSFLSDLLSIVAAVPDRHGAGIFYWQPEWIPGVGWAPGEGTPNDNLTRFDFHGHALPSIDFPDPPRAAVVRHRS